MSNNLVKRYRVIDSEFNRSNYAFIVGDLFHNPPGYAQVEKVWIDAVVEYNRYNNSK